MSEYQKSWTRLGLGTAATVGLIVTGCAPTDGAEDASVDVPVAAAPDTAIADVPTTASAGEGEGGVSIDQAATDPVVYLSALAIAEAHVLAARDAYALGETDAAAEMFAHPVSEVLADMQPTFEARGVADFTDLFLDAADAVYAGGTADQISMRAEAIIAALRSAEAYAPEDGRSESVIWAGVAADQIDRAADMYAIAQGTDQYGPYLDGYGFLKAAEAVLNGHERAIAAERPATSDAISAAIALLGDAYPTAVRPETLDQNPAALKATASRVQLTLN